MKNLLEGLRVLDLTDEKGMLCGRMLADLGAEVVKIEKPMGDPSRQIGPFYHNVPHPERSLYWFAYNLNKKGITLDIETLDGQDLFKKLVAKADVVVESFPVSYLKKIGLDYRVLSEINPQVCMASITPFGQTGPYNHYKGSDIVGMAMSGYLHLCGDPDRPPLRIGVPQANFHGASEAAAAIMVALFYRDQSGKGQFIDVSIQQSMVSTTLQAIPFWQLANTNLERSGDFRVGLSSGARSRQTWPCKDGAINFVLYGGTAGSSINTNLVKWMTEENMVNDYLMKIDFPNWDVFKITQEEMDKVEEPIYKFFMNHTKDELQREGAKKKVPIVPVSSVSEVVNSEQLKAREFWIGVEHPELGETIRYPGFAMKLSQAPCQVRYRAPLIGEHNLEIYQNELGLSKKQLLYLVQSKVI